MTLHVVLSTTLRDHVPGYDPLSGLELTLSPPCTALDLARHLHLPVQEIKIIMRNGRRCEGDTLLSDGDRIAFFPAVGGG